MHRPLSLPVSTSGHRVVPPDSEVVGETDLGVTISWECKSRYVLPSRTGCLPLQGCTLPTPTPVYPGTSRR